MKNGRLLIVDDEADLVDLLKTEFEGLGLECATAGTGYEALDVIRKFTPDAVLCDMAMPGMDGMDLLIELRELGNHVPLIFLTGHGDKKLAIRALKHGAFDFHEKPYDREALVASVFKAVEFGLEMRTIEQELDEICASKNLPPEELQEYRAIRKFLLRNRKHMNVLLKKAG